MIDVNTSWSKIRENAIKALKTKMTWHSLVEQAHYTLIDVFEDRIIIQRSEGRKNQKLTESKVIRAANDFNNSGCRIKRRHLITPTVAEETAFVLFHPQLSWDDDNEYIIQV